MNKILIIILKPIDKTTLAPLIQAINKNFNDSKIDILTIFTNKDICQSLLLNGKIHIVQDEKSNANFLKKIFLEVKAIFQIKKEKYNIAIQATGIKREIIIAKYAKIPIIVGFETKDKKINNLITHKINSQNNVLEIFAKISQNV